MNPLGKSSLELFGGAYIGQWAYNKWLSPKVPAGIANDLARAVAVGATIMAVRYLLKGKA